MIMKNILSSAALSVLMMASALQAMQGSTIPLLKSDADLKSASKEEIANTMQFVVDQVQIAFDTFGPQMVPLAQALVKNQIKSLHENVQFIQKSSASDLQSARDKANDILNEVKRHIVFLKSSLVNSSGEALQNKSEQLAINLAKVLLTEYKSDAIAFLTSRDASMQVIKTVQAGCNMVKDLSVQLDLADEQKAAVGQISSLINQPIQTLEDIKNLVQQISVLGATLNNASSTNTDQHRANSGVATSGQAPANTSAKKQAHTNHCGKTASTNAATQNGKPSLKKDEPKLKLEKNDTATQHVEKDKQDDDKNKKSPQSDTGMISNLVSTAKNRWYLIAAPVALISFYLLYLHVHSYDEYDQQDDMA